MALKSAVIVALTRMSGAKVCVGAVSDRGEDLRLLNRFGQAADTLQTKYRVGEWWRIDCEPCGPRRPPHVEDVAVLDAMKSGAEEDLLDFLLTNTTPRTGPMDALFDGMLRFTSQGSGYVSAAAIPSHATGFWVPSGPLHLETDSGGSYYRQQNRRLRYVGTAAAIPVIEAGRLVRVSLARWWRPSGAGPLIEARCYLQLSGWY